LNPKEGMKKAMDRKEQNRVPVMCQMSIGHMLLQTGFSPSEFWFSAEVFAEGLLELRRIYDFDGILISLHGHWPGWRKEVAKIQLDEKAEVLFWKNGDRTVFPFDDLPRHYASKMSSPPSIKEFELESMPEDIDFIPVSQGLEFHIEQEHKYEIFDLVQSRAGERFSIHGEVTSPFDYYLNLFGFENAIINLIEEPSKSKEILQRYTEGVRRIAQEQVEHGVDAIKISSPYAGAGFISPSLYREFVLPYESQIARAVRGSGVHIYTHTCGAINDRLEMMVEAGISGLECLDPPPLGNVNLDEAKKRIGQRVFIKGNVDPVNVLLLGSRETVRKDAAEKIEVGRPGGGYILSTACSIAPYTKKENVQVLAQVAEEMGTKL
jgi:MtaA/CmuA family methyltransferase